MSNVQLIIEERAADIGNFLVGWLLPFRQKRAVGPFVFIDHMGPVQLKDYENLDVPPHPHIGLSTLTYLFEGAIFHRDSLGTAMEIEPGAVNWMTAGNGVAAVTRYTSAFAACSTKTTCIPNFFQNSKALLSRENPRDRRRAGIAPQHQGIA